MTQPTPTGTGHVLALALVIVKRRSTRSELNLGMSVIGTQEAYGRAGRGSAYRGSAEARVRRAERPPMTRDPTAVANVVDFLTRRFGLGV
jgi:hypothetical protein